MTPSTAWDPLDHLVTVTVAERDGREVQVRLADGRPGVIDARDFDGLPPPAVGEDILAVMLTRDDPQGRSVLSRKVARAALAWRDVAAAKDADEPVQGTVRSATKGGYVVDVGVRAFLPSSLARDGDDESSDLVGQDIEALVVDLDRDKERLVLSRRDLIRRRRRARDREVVASLTPGDQVTARVTRVADFGLLVDVDGVQALVPRGELEWDPRRSPGSVAAIGDEVEGVVLDVAASKGRVRLSMKRRRPDPFTLVAPGDRVPGRVARVVDYGAFVEIADGALVGLCHISELTDDVGARPDELVVPGDEVVVKVLSMDRRKWRISLSVTQGMWG